MNNDDNSQAPPVFSPAASASDASSGLYSGPGDQPVADITAPTAGQPAYQPPAQDQSQGQASAGDDLASQFYSPGGPVGISDSDLGSASAGSSQAGADEIGQVNSPLGADSTQGQGAEPVFTADPNLVDPAPATTVINDQSTGDQPYVTSAGDVSDPSTNLLQDQQVPPSPLQEQAQSPNDINAVVAAISTGNNILITVSNNPTIDELSAAIGLTLALDKSGKKVTSVYSGKTPHAIEFLDPEATFQDNVTSLRDFIISLDKSKADKLKYKVDNESGTVKIFITPYKTTISSSDLDFSSGDYNVDMVIALGVKNREDFDNCILSHGRILHDAQIITINSGDDVSALGSINYEDREASSISEIVTNVIDSLGVGMVDSQVATALMTGIVAATDRFSNVKTTPKVMQVASRLMSAGANQQLISSSVSGSSTQIEPGSLRRGSSPKSEDAEMVVEHKDVKSKNIGNKIKADGTDRETSGVIANTDTTLDAKLKGTSAIRDSDNPPKLDLLSEARNQVLVAEEQTSSNAKQAVGLDGVVDVDRELQPVEANLTLAATDDKLDSSVQEKQSNKADEIKLNAEKSTTPIQAEVKTAAKSGDQPVIDIDLPPLPPMPPSFDDPTSVLPPIGDFQPSFMDNLDSSASISDSATELANKRQADADKQASMDAKFNAIYGDDPNKIEQPS